MRRESSSHSACQTARRVTRTRPLTLRAAESDLDLGAKTDVPDTHDDDDIVPQVAAPIVIPISGTADPGSSTGRLE